MSADISSTALIGSSDDLTAEALHRLLNLAMLQTAKKYPHLDQATVEDIASTAVHQFWQKVREAEQEGSPLADQRRLFNTIVHHRAVDEVRRWKNQRQKERKAADQAEVQSRTNAARADLGECFLDPAFVAALSRLGPKDRVAIELMALDDYTQKQVSERTGEPLGTVASRVNRAKAFLREELAWAKSPQAA